MKDFLRTKTGSVVNVAIYIALSGAIASLIDWTSTIDLTNSPMYTVTVVGVVNLVLVGIKQYMKK